MTLPEIRQRLMELANAANGDDDPMASDEAQSLLREERRLNRIELDKLHVGNRARLMFGQPLLPDSTLQ